MRPNRPNNTATCCSVNMVPYNLPLMSQFLPVFLKAPTLRRAAWSFCNCVSFISLVTYDSELSYNPGRGRLCQP